MPFGVDDPLRPSGGNHYDRRLCEELERLGWDVHERHATGAWPTPAQVDRDRFARLLASIPDGSLVLVDGLIASGADVLVEASHRFRLAVLVHMPDATEDVETAVLNAAAAVITTSAWSRDRIVETHGVPPERVWVALPGVDPEHLAWAVGSDSGGQLLCVGPVTPAKGQDVLVDALAELADLPWKCALVGSLDLDPAFVAMLRATTERTGLADRISFVGPLSRDSLASIRSETDLLIAASHREAYGMAVIESLATGTPVVATLVGGHREALGQTSDGTLPGTLIPDDDADALAHVLRQWLTDSELRHRWRTSAIERRDDLPGWADAARAVATALHAI